MNFTGSDCQASPRVLAGGRTLGHLVILRLLIDSSPVNQPYCLAQESLDWALLGKWP